MLTNSWSFLDRCNKCRPEISGDLLQHVNVKRWGKNLSWGEAIPRSDRSRDAKGGLWLVKQVTLAER